MKLEKLPILNFPKYKFTFDKRPDELFILDAIRQKYILLTPEEWVRQHLLTYLVKEKKYPGSLISIEKGVTINKLTKRYDAVVYGRDMNALMLIECKAPKVSITQQTFDQALVYNQKILADYIILTNGLTTNCIKVSSKKVELCNTIPFFTDITM